MQIKLLLLCLGLALTGMATMVQAIEEPAFENAGQVGNVELRDYAATIQARTPSARESGSSSTFRRLAGYIFGGNATETSIAMTAPVETHMAKDGYMAFTMPSQYGMADLPAPLDDSVSLHQVPSRRLAVISFGGWATDGKVERKTAELLNILESNGIGVAGPPSLHQYNPPWTPPWSRRNEVVVEVVVDTRR